MGVIQQVKKGPSRIRQRNSSCLPQDVVHMAGGRKGDGVLCGLEFTDLVTCHQSYRLFWLR